MHQRESYEDQFERWYPDQIIHREIPDNPHCEWIISPSSLLLSIYALEEQDEEIKALKWRWVLESHLLANGYIKLFQIRSQNAFRGMSDD